MRILTRLGGARSRRAGLAVGALLATMLFGADAALADRVHLRSGVVVEGQAQRTPEGWRVRLPNGLEVVLGFDEVERVEATPTPREEYAARLAALEATEIDAHYRLGLFASDQGLRAEADERFRHVLALSPDHEGARAALGQVFHGGRWVPLEQANLEQGLVRHGERWVTSEEKARLDHADAVRAERARLHAAVKRLRLDGIDAAVRAAAFADIADSDRPEAVRPLLDLASYSHPDVRRAVVTALARYGDAPDVQEALAQAASADASLDVQDAAARAIRAGRMTRAADLLLERYAESPHAHVRAASAHALGIIRYKPAGPQLVATLTMRVYRRRVLPTRIDPVVRRTHNGVEVRGVVRYRTYGFTPGDYRMVADVAFNDPARVALRALTGVDHDFDQPRWMAWWRAHWTHFDDFMEPVPADPG